jgi:catalase
MSDRGIPDGFRHMHGYYGHTLKFVNKKGEWQYVQLHLISDQGIKTLTNEEAGKLSPDHGQKDLYEAIERGEFPSWTMKVQTMTQAQAVEAWEKKGINVHDLTHIWPHADYPLRTVGRIKLNENAANYFAEVEQAAFSPSHMVPGIEPSADPVLQSRLFSYPDTHRHRLGTNYQQLPVNQSVTGYAPSNFQRDGAMSFYNQGGRPGYLSTQDAVTFQPAKVNVDAVHGGFVAQAVSFLSAIRPEDFNAPRNLWHKVFSQGERDRWIATVSGHMSTVKDKEIIRRQIGIWREVSEDIASRLEQATGIKGYPGIKGVQFNGSGNAMDASNLISANGSKVGGVAQNGAPSKAKL